MGVIGFAVFAGLYYWFPLYTGRMYQQRLGKWHFWLSMIGTNVTFFAMIFLGYGGMPRRYANYEVTLGPQALFTDLHQLATVGAFILLIGQMIFVYNFVLSWLEGPKVRDGDPWNLDEHGMKTREWDWFKDNKILPMTDGGENSEDGQSSSELRSDGGEVDGEEASGELETDGGKATDADTDADAADASDDASSE